MLYICDKMVLWLGGQPPIYRMYSVGSITFCVETIDFGSSTFIF